MKYGIRVTSPDGAMSKSMDYLYKLCEARNIMRYIGRPAFEFPIADKYSGINHLSDLIHVGS